MGCAGERRRDYGGHHSPRGRSSQIKVNESFVARLKNENHELREMLIQNGLFMRVTQGMHELGLEV